MTADQAAAARRRLEPLDAELGRVLVGLRGPIDRLVIALLTGGHVLLEGVPGLAKTLAVRALARALRLSFARVQFTPDLLPADVIGTQIYRPHSGDFTLRRGPVFAHVVLADEINRAPAKVQSALLEAMQELQVTLGDQTHPLPRPFFVLATQNPIEQEGTYPLPEAQLDRFLFKLRLDYPDRDDELAILDRHGGSTIPEVAEVLSADDIAALAAAVDSIYVEVKIREYITDLVRATRAPERFGDDLAGRVRFGAGPRATLGLFRASKAHALLAGRHYVVPHDVKQLAPDVLRHRILMSYEAEAGEAGVEELIGRLLERVPVP